MAGTASFPPSRARDLEAHDTRGHFSPRPGGVVPASSPPGRGRHPPGPPRNRAARSTSWPTATGPTGAVATGTRTVAVSRIAGPVTSLAVRGVVWPAFATVRPWEYEDCSGWWSRFRTWIPRSPSTDALGLAERYRAGEVAALGVPGRDLEVLLHRRPPSPSRTAVAASFLVDDVDAVTVAAHRAGATVLKHPSDEPWGERQAVLCDPDGHLLCLVQTDR